MRQGGSEFLGACAAEASEPQSLDAGYSKVNHAGEFGCEIRRAVLAQATLRLLGGKPSGIAIGLLRWFKA